MATMVTTFARRDECEKARASLDAAGLPYEVISPDSGYSLVGEPAIVVDGETRMILAKRSASELVCSGWVEFCAPGTVVPKDAPAAFEEDVFGRAAVMVLVPCVADTTRIRIIAHLTGDMGEAFPYLNAEMREACYNPNGPTFTFMDGYRMVSMYPRRIAVAKADDIVDAWRVLEMIRRRANEVWARRHEITPSYDLREKPPALEIFKRLPRTNCRACGELTCLAFAVKVWQGYAVPTQCHPVFGGDYAHLKDALIEICAGLGVSGVVSGGERP